MHIDDIPDPHINYLVFVCSDTNHINYFLFVCSVELGNPLLVSFCENPHPKRLIVILRYLHGFVQLNIDNINLIFAQFIIDNINLTFSQLNIDNINLIFSQLNIDPHLLSSRLKSCYKD